MKEEELDEQTKRGLDAVYALTDEWWARCDMEHVIVGLASMVPGPFKERTFDTLRAFLKQSHAEGLYEGFCAGRDMGKAELEARLAAVTHPEAKG